MRSLLVALDSAPSSASVLSAAAELALELGAELVLFRSSGLPTQAVAGSAEGERFEQAIDGETLRGLDQRRAELPANLHVRLRTGHGPPAPAILVAAREEGAALVVMGRAGQGERSAGVGHVTRAVLAEADRPVVVVNPGASAEGVLHRGP